MNSGIINMATRAVLPNTPFVNGRHILPQMFHRDSMDAHAVGYYSFPWILRQEPTIHKQLSYDVLYQYIL
jgi:hypothetical protein